MSEADYLVFSISNEYDAKKDPTVLSPAEGAAATSPPASTAERSTDTDFMIKIEKWMDWSAEESVQRNVEISKSEPTYIWLAERTDVTPVMVATLRRCRVVRRPEENTGQMMLVKQLKQTRRNETL
jgi:hypothetical protein